MRCTRCNVYMAEYGNLCSSCHMARSIIPEYDETASDDEIIEKSLLLLIFNGCRECNDKSFAYEAGIMYEGEFKYYMAQVDCAACDSKYTEIMDVRLIDPDENETDTTNTNGGQTRNGKDDEGDGIPV